MQTTTASHRTARASRTGGRRTLALCATALAGGAGLYLGVALPSGASTKASVSHSSATVTVMTTHNAHLGTILVSGSGRTLYRYTPDRANKSNCFGACDASWPPLMLAKGTKSPTGKGVPHLGTIARSGGHQVTYRGIPLYEFVGDKKAGQANGQGLYHKWYVVKLSSTPTKSSGGGGGGATTTTQPYSYGY